MKKKDLPQMQHYLPQGYLRGFTNHGHRDKKGHVRVIDLLKRRCFSCPPKSVASIRNYYVYQNTDGKLDYSLETDVFAQLDGDLVSIIRDIEGNRSVPDGERWANLCWAIAFLELRTPHFRQMNQELAQEYYDVMAHLRFGTPEAFENSKRKFEQETDEKAGTRYEDVRQIMDAGGLLVDVPRQDDIQMMLKMAPQLANIIHRMTPHLVFAAENGRFVTGDCPIYFWDCDDERRKRKQEGVGWMTPEVEVTLPLTSRCCLVLNWDAKPKVLDVENLYVASYNGFRAHRTRQYLFFPPNSDVPFLDADGKVVWGENRFIERFSGMKATQPTVEITGGPIPRRPVERVRR